MRSKEWRRVALPGALLVGVVTSGLMVSADAAPPPPGPVAAVGENPAVQQWFKRQEAARIALNNALQQAYLQLDGAPGAANGCAQVRDASRAVLGLPPTPKQTLNPLVVAGVSQFQDGAIACLAGDTAGARQLFAAGAQARADADNEVEDVLEAPDGTVK